MPNLSFSPRVPVIDANVCVGDSHLGPSPCRNADQLLDEMSRHGVSRALIYHAQTEEISPIDGNVMLEDWVNGTDLLIPQWSALPTEDSLAQLKELAKTGRVSSVRLSNTADTGLPFRPWAFDGLLSWLSENGIPLWIPLPDMDADDLVSTLQTYPKLSTVLVGAHYSHSMVLHPLLNAVPNAHLELSRYEPIGEVESLCSEFGVRRFVYGSWYSRYAMGPILFYLHHTDLDEEALRLICGGNVLRILAGDHKLKDGTTDIGSQS